MDNRAEVREFLMTRRAKVTPQQAGLPEAGGRRVAGLRRSEVATLAGMSVEYYAKLERGAIAGASASVLNSLATALQLDDTEHRHLLDLARAADGIPTSSRPRRRSGASPAPVRHTLQWMLDSLTGTVAFVRDQHQNLVAANALGRAFYLPVLGDEEGGADRDEAADGGARLTADLTTGRGRIPNLARFQFLDPASRDFYPEWERFAQMCVGSMRVEVGKDPHDTAMQDLVGELSTCSEDFRRLWAAHDVHTHGSGTKLFRHPVVGEVTVAYEELLLSAEPGRALITYTAEPGSTSEERLRLLATWAATRRRDRADEAASVDARTD
ncbi:helix-turn-helix transcriptional regulator [Brachybacterium sp.]|uniref:helix-turn-helix transcriptional regulator n=1 Tax=Brachybacterium sp. TaxID=1891286 RepID=UPI002ED2A11A